MGRWRRAACRQASEQYRCWRRIGRDWVAQTRQRPNVAGACSQVASETHRRSRGRLATAQNLHHALYMAGPVGYSTSRPRTSRNWRQGDEGTMKRFCLIVMALLIAIGYISPANATPNEPAGPQTRPVQEIVLLSDDYAAASSTLAITMDSNVSVLEAQSLVRGIVGQGVINRLSGSTMTVQVPATVVTERLGRSTSNESVPFGQPNGELLLCDQYYAFSDANGTYTIQRACTSSSAPWSFRLSPALQAGVVGTVNEAGMTWKKNGITQPRMAPHPVAPPDYRFHGTYSNVPAGSRVSYNDVLTWRFSNGNAKLTIYGNFTLTGNRPCQPGGPC